jgi:hypothetical protein
VGQELLNGVGADEASPANDEKALVGQVHGRPLNLEVESGFRFGFNPTVAVGAASTASSD